MSPTTSTHPNAHWDLTDFISALDIAFPTSLVSTWALAYGMRQSRQFKDNGNAQVAIAAMSFASLLTPSAAIPSFFTTLGGGTGDDYGRSVQPTPDGGFILTGYTRSFGARDADVLLAKFENNGDLTWAKTLGGGGDDEGNSVQPTPDGDVGWTE